MLPTVVDVIIVLSAVYVALSCLISWMNETIQSLLRARGAYLYRGILNLLCGHDDLVKAIFTSPYVASASSDASGRIVDRASTAPGVAKSPSGIRRAIPWARTYRPSYMNPRAFSVALWDALRRLDTLGSPAPLLTAPDALLADLRARVTALDAINRPLATVLANLLNHAQADYDALLRATERWFNAQMDNVSGWYKRYIQWFIVAIAFFVVSFSGVDTLQIATIAYGNPDLAKLIIQPVSSALSSPNNVSSAIYAALEKVNYFGCHFSWDPRANWASHWAGMLLTLAALTLGGTFWFDVLKTLVNVRMEGPKPK